MNDKHTDTEQRRGLASTYDWLFTLWVALVIASAWVFIGAPLLVAFSSRFTRLGQSRGRQITLWVIAAAITLYNLVPLLIIWLGLSTTSVNEHRFIVG